MSSLQTIVALLSGIFRTRVRGGRIKRFLVFVSSFIVVLGSIWLMYRWTNIPTSTHIVYLDHPYTVDTDSNHYVEVDFCLTSGEGFTLKDLSGRSDIFVNDIRFTQSNKKKEKNTSLPTSNDVMCINYYLNDSIIVDGDSLSSIFFDAHDVGNLLVVGHYYNSTHLDNFVHYPEKEFIPPQDDGCKIASFIINNHRFLASLPLSNKFNQKLSDGKVGFTSKFAVDWSYILFSNIGGTQVFRKNSSSYREKYGISELFTLNDISKSNYEFFVFTKSIDKVNIVYEANEIVDFNDIFTTNTRDSRKISISLLGDNYSEREGLSGCRGVIFCLRNLESENVQLVRMFLLMTLCSFALGFFLKSSSDYIWVIIRKIQKLKLQQNEDI